MKCILPSNSIIHINGFPCRTKFDTVIETETPLSLEPWDKWLIPRVCLKVALLIGAVIYIMYALSKQISVML